MTSLRDPITWKIYKKIIELFDSAVHSLPGYARNELYFPGVEVSNVVIKKMTTSCDNFEFDVTDALKSNETTNNIKVKFSQSRLNHKPFSIKLNISSYVSQKGLVKIYLTPKVLPSKLGMKRDNFYLIDYFDVNLKAGANIIPRTSEEIKLVSNDFMSIQTILKSIEDASFGLETLPLNDIKSTVMFPSRLLLPKGSPAGMLYELFIFVAPYFKSTVSNMYTSEFNAAILSPGYPFDLNINNELFELPNTCFKEIIITHKSENKMSNSDTVNNWNKKAYDPSSRPTYDYTSKRQSGSFDYNAKKAQYNKNTSNFPKTDDLEEIKGSAQMKQDEEIHILPVTAENVINEKNLEPTNIISDSINDDIISHIQNTVQNVDVSK